MKSFKEFNIITEGRSKAQAEKSRQSKSNPSEWVLVNSGTDTSPFWSVRKKSGGEQSVPTRAVGPGPSKTSPESKERQNRAAAKSGNQKTAPEKKETEKKPNWYNTGPEPDKEKSEAPKKRPDVGIPEKDWDKQKEKNKKAPKKRSDVGIPEKDWDKQKEKNKKERKGGDVCLPYYNPNDPASCNYKGRDSKGNLKPKKPEPEITKHKKIDGAIPERRGTKENPVPPSKSKSSLISNYGKARSVKQVDGWGKTSYGTGSTQNVSGAKKSGYVSGPFKGKSSSTSSKGSGGSKAFGMRDVKVNDPIKKPASKGSGGSKAFGMRDVKVNDPIKKPASPYKRDAKTIYHQPVKSVQGGGKEPFIKKSTSTSAASASASQIKKKSRTAPYRRDAKTVYHQQRK